MTIATARKRRRFTPREFAQKVGVKQARVYKWIERGIIDATKYGFDDHPMILIDEDQLAVAKTFAASVDA